MLDTAPDSIPPASRQSRAAGLLKLALAAAVAAAVIVIARALGGGTALKATLAWISSLGAIAPIVFICAYILACVFFLPGALMTLGAGVLFGVVWGSVYTSIGATLGATAAFLIGRYVARDWVARKLAANARFRAIDAAVGRQGWKIVGLTRLSPVFPFNLLNYAFGLTRVRLGEYVLASWIGMTPGIVLYAYLGSLAGDVTQIGVDRGLNSTARWVFNGIGLAATVAVVWYVARIARNALAEATRMEDSNGGSGSPHDRATRPA
jgi:uncharacterized membrane protein YdjX (TVP38/TMEM64 family)